MKKLFSTLFLAAGLTAAAYAQAPNFGLQITEIMYNSPESGTDSLEFIELYNGGNAPLDVSGYKVNIGTSGNPRLTFPAGTTLAPHAVIILALNDSTFASVYGVAPDYKLAGSGLGNNGSTITVVNANDATVTSVSYVNTWFPATAGNGASLNRCNFSEDVNTAAAWAASTTSVGTAINGKDLLASPGASERCVVVTTPVYPIGTINTQNADGVVDSANVSCEIRGVIHSDDFRGTTGIEFALIDSNNDGIMVFSNSDLTGFTVNRGDSVHVKGIVSQYNGLAQFTPSNIEIMSSGNALVTPLVVTEINEATEGSLVKLEGLKVDEITNSTAAGFNILATDANNVQHNIRVDADTDAFTYTFAVGTEFDVTGIGTQFDNSNPFTEGYQLIARDLADFDFVVAVNEALAAKLSIYPNPTNNVFTVSSEREFNQVIITNTIGQVVAQYNAINNNQFQINTNNLVNGLYQVTVISAEGQATKLVRIQK